MLTRIYGYAFNTKEELQEYLKFLEEAKKRDHRILGQKLNLYTIKPEEVGAGLILWKPK
jgi:threonyl-tRNA synthetase